MGKLVRIADFLDPEEALIAKGLLESGGIPATLYGLNHVSLEPHLRQAFQGLSLWVPDADAEDARAALEEVHAGRFLFPEEGEVKGPGPAEPRCSACGSTRLRRVKSLFWLPLALFAWVPFLPAAKRRECLDCGHIGLPSEDAAPKPAEP